MDRISEMALDPRAPAAPPNTKLALWTDLDRFSGAQVFEWLHRGRRSGFLRANSGDHRKGVILHEGSVSFAASNQRIDRLGPALVRAALLSPEALHDANREAHAAERFGKTLVTKGYLAPRDLWGGIRAQLEEIVWSIFAYRSGELTFWEGDVQSDNLVRIEFESAAFLQRGRAWADALVAWIDRARDAEARFVPIESLQALGWLEGVEAHVVDTLRESTIDGRGAPFDGLCRRAGIDEMTMARTLRFLESQALVRLDAPNRDLRAHAEHGGDRRAEQVRRRLNAAANLVEGLAAPLRGVSDPDAVWRRVGEMVDEIAARFPGAMTGLSLAPDMNLPVSRLEKQILGGPQGLESDHFAAIDALLDTLEFELRNHPEVAGAEAILESHRSLRSELAR